LVVAAPGLDRAAARSRARSAVACTVVHGIAIPIGYNVNEGCVVLMWACSSLAVAGSPARAPRPGRRPPTARGREGSAMTQDGTVITGPTCERTELEMTSSASELRDTRDTRFGLIQQVQLYQLGSLSRVRVPVEASRETGEAQGPAVAVGLYTRQPGLRLQLSGRYALSSSSTPSAELSFCRSY
jgi:hypothetical protein